MCTLFRILNERTWPSVFGMPVERSAIPRHPGSFSKMTQDPNNGWTDDQLNCTDSVNDIYVNRYVLRCCAGVDSAGGLLCLAAYYDV
jgi:hypothetical protein